MGGAFPRDHGGKDGDFAQAAFLPVAPVCWLWLHVLRFLLFRKRTCRIHFTPALWP